MIYVTINFNYNSCFILLSNEIHTLTSIVHLTRLTDEKYRRVKKGKRQKAERRKEMSQFEKRTADKTPEVTHGPRRLVHNNKPSLYHYIDDSKKGKEATRKIRGEKITQMLKF